MTDFEIFKKCFPEYVISEEIFTRIADADSCGVFRSSGGFAYARGNRIELLCVAPEFQKRGEGRELLQKCERYIAENGHSSAEIGGGMVCGAEARSAGFFERQGYSIGGDFVEMELALSGFSVAEAQLPENAEFGFYKGGIETLRRAVWEVDEDWVQYFDEDGLFFCCFMDGEIASFCIIGEDEDCLLSDGSAKIGSIGCVGTVPKFRRRGTGLHMVALGAQWLKEQGCDKVFIHYTHLEKWYGKLGARTFQRFVTAEKVLS